MGVENGDANLISNEGTSFDPDKELSLKDLVKGKKDND